MTTQQQAEVPAGFTLPEWMVHQELTRRGLREPLDFTFQSPLFGGRVQRGGLVIDFLFANPPDLAFSVLGVYWHRGAVTDARDLMARAQLAGEGITLVFLDEQDIYNDVRHVVGEALQYRDNSRLGRSA
jgi:hypothetical protein